MKILLAEDDEYLSSALCLALRRKGHEVYPARTGTEAGDALATDSYDIVLLDLGLPDKDGKDILQEIRQRGAEYPIIIITARDGLEERIAGLDMGANDYLIKPFDFRELEARMRAAVRQSHWRNRTEIRLGQLRLDTNSGAVYLGDEHLDLTPKEAFLLKALLERAGKPVSKRQLMQQADDWADEASENAVEIVVHRLRKKLEMSDVAITTMRGFGYVLKEKA